METNVGREIAALQRMTVKQLRQKYMEVFDEETNGHNKAWLVKRIAWRLQARAEGGLSERARRRATELADDADLRMNPPPMKATTPVEDDVPPVRVWLDWVQGGLDVIGVFDPTPLSDGVNALISAGRGDWTGAGLSAIIMIPYAGDVIGKGGKVVRYGKKTVDAIEGAKPAAKQLVAPKGLLNEGARATELADEALLNKLRVRGFTIDQSAEIQRYLDYRKANAATFLEKDLLLRPDARKIEVLEEYLHNVQKDIGLMNKMTPAQMEVHVKEFMLRHKKMLGISEADAQWLKNWLDKAKGQ
jgi:hypothetical protein